MTTGGFEYSADNESIVARLSIDVPQDGIQNLREITTETQRFRVELEAASRTGKDFVQYLNQLPEIQNKVTQAQKNLITQLERTVDAQQRMMQGSGQSYGVPAGTFQNPWAGVSEGMGSRMPSPTDIQAQIGQVDTRTLVNRAVQTGGLRPSDVAPQAVTEEQLTQDESREGKRQQAHQVEHAKHQAAADPYGHLRQQITQGGGMVTSLINELGPGGSNVGMMNILSKGLGALGKGAEVPQNGPGVVKPGGPDLGDVGQGIGGLATIAKMAGGLGPLLGAAAPIGLGVGAAASGLYAFEKGGEAIQGYRTMGQTRGGGWQEGLGYEMNIRSMGLNPFLTTEQARKIVQQGLTEGYTGKEFDTVTAFVAQNLKDMNIDIGDSFAMVKKNVKEGGQSIAGLGAQLAELKTLSQTGYRSLGELTTGFKETSGALITGGMPAGLAGETAETYGQMWVGSETLKGTGEQAAQAMQGNPIAAMIAARQAGIRMPPGALPETYGARMGEQGPAAFESVMRNCAEQATRQSPGDPYNAAAFFIRYLKAYGFGNISWVRDNNITAAMEAMQSVLNGSPVKQAEQRHSEAEQKSLTVEDRGYAAGISRGLGGLVGAVGATARDLFTGKGTQKEGDYIASAHYASQQFHLPMLDAIVSAYGSPNDIEIMENGKPRKLKLDDKGELERLARGELKWRKKGDTGPGITMEQTPTAVDRGFTTDKVSGGTANVQGTLNINVNPPEMKKALGIGDAPVTLTPTKRQVNQGWGDARLNNPVPGM